MHLACDLAKQYLQVNLKSGTFTIGHFLSVIIAICPDFECFLMMCRFEYGDSETLGIPKSGQPQPKMLEEQLSICTYTQLVTKCSHLDQYSFALNY